MPIELYLVEITDYIRKDQLPVKFGINLLHEVGMGGENITEFQGSKLFNRHLSAGKIYSVDQILKNVKDKDVLHIVMYNLISFQMCLNICMMIIILIQV